MRLAQLSAQSGPVVLTLTDADALAQSSAQGGTATLTLPGAAAWTSPESEPSNPQTKGYLGAVPSLPY